MSSEKNEIINSEGGRAMDAGAAVGFPSDVLTITRAEEAALTAVDAGGLEAPARKAVSCLVEPMIGDKVLTTRADGHTYILAVLERTAEAPLKIATEGELQISARSLAIKTGVFDLVTEAANLVGHAFNSLFRTSKRVSGTDTVIAHSTSLNAQERVDMIAGADIQQAAVFSQNVEGPIAQNSHTAVVTAKTDIRLSAERINVG